MRQITIINTQKVSFRRFPSKYLVEHKTPPPYFNKLKIGIALRFFVCLLITLGEVRLGYIG